MKDRRQIIMASFAAVAVLVTAWYFVDLLFLSPSARCDADIERLNRELKKLKLFNSQEVEYRDKLDSFATRSLSVDPDGAREHLRRRFSEMVETSGLKCVEDRAFSSVTPGGVSGVYREVGWKCSLVGSLQQIVHLLYLAQSDPYLHKINNLVIVPERDRKNARVSFSYTTLVLERKEDKKLVPAGEKRKPTVSLAASDAIKVYEAIAARNIFRPYVKKRPPQKVVRKPPKNPPVRPRPKPSTDGLKKVVSLTRWDKGPEICVLDTRSGKTERLEVGDALAGGTIICVDYRKLPLPNKPETLSQSRVIIKIGSDYFAVELGWTLNRRYLVQEDRLPPGISDSSGEEPAAEARSKPASAG